MTVKALPYSLMRVLHAPPRDINDERVQAAFAAEQYALDNVRDSARRSEAARQAHEYALGL